jgi:hypothetical protein
MLGELREHDVLVALVRHTDMAGGLNDRIEHSQRHHVGTVAHEFVAKATAGLAAVPVHFRRSRILDEIVLAFENCNVIPDSELHRGSRLLTAHVAVAPTGQYRISRHLALKGAAHASPVASCHGAIFVR